MQQLKKDPLNNALKLKLKAVQQHIAELGSRQKKILGTIKLPGSSGQPLRNEIKNQASGAAKVQNKESLKGPLEPNTKSEPNEDAVEPISCCIQSSVSGTNGDTKQSYTLITIKNRPRTVSSSSGQGSSVKAEHLPINLTCIPKISSPVLVVSSPNQDSSNNPVICASGPTKSVPLSISLSSLVSTGGVVTLAGGWKGPPRSVVGATSNNSMVDAIGRIVPGKPVQIKVPVVQTPGSSPLFLMQQKPATSQSKSLFRLLPKGRHPIPLSQVRQNVNTKGLQFVSSSGQGYMARAPIVTPRPLPTLLVPKEAVRNPEKYQQVVLQRTTNPPSLPTTAPAANSVTWQDLSSKTPGIHKPSYVPRKSFPNMNNGVGSFQKFRILDGKAQMLPKQVQEVPTRPGSSSISNINNHVGMEKPRNTALKAVLTSSKPTTSGMVTVARLVPATVPKNGFYPIQQRRASTKSVALLEKQLSAAKANGSSFLPLSMPVAVSTAISSFRPMNDSPTITAADDNNADEEMKEKLGFLRNINLIPKEQADRVRNRRFRKRRVAANPIYSGGMYVSNEVEPKRYCPDVLMGALDGITPPGVIIKRPRGRPRGSSKSASPAQLLQRLTSSKNIRSSTGSPVTPAHMEELRQLRGILDVVASASKAVSASAAIGVKAESEMHSWGKAMTSKLLVAVSGKDHMPAESKSVNVKDTNGDHDEDEHEDQCAVCSRTGEVLMCDTCSRVYHLACTTPPLTMVPQGMWVCSKCKTDFKASKSKVEWPGIVHVVHSYVDFDKQRDSDIDAEKELLRQSKKMVNGLQAQTKALTTVVMEKVNLRSKAMKEKQGIHKDILDLRHLLQNVWNLAVKGPSGSQ